ncbi:5'-methylthioadenosine/S-adenosylhomocysteine nucleosidase [Neobacillus kokaensis]|uniref:MTA/SAH nucleosidase n=1 Tax=Neobacillus kokaensis TaxID=2759023 RepID=A0ABQ3N5L0_9BACI|nr:5'-methylthioadenosine/S-adenosylhomocysteine nucleosidase [Neobacillus kokaensis]GHI00215.1 MTA/SAH nucleosidase [Neobacillus kokaensis]
MNKRMTISFFAVMLISALLLAGFSSIKNENKKAGHEQKKTEQPIAIQGAMDIEISALLKAMRNYKEEQIGNYTFYTGKIDKIPVVVSRTEIGMVNAAASTTLLIDKYHPKVIINQGTAGGHDPNIHVFDTVIGTEVMNIGSMRSEHLDDGEGMKPETWKFMATSIRENGKKVEYESFKSDPELVKAALSVANKYSHGKVVEGKVGSADFWNREVDRIQWFHEKAGTSVEEMEAASVAQVAKAFNIPYLSIRTVSNSEVSGDKIEDLETAGQYGAEFAVEIVKAIGK